MKKNLLALAALGAIAGAAHAQSAVTIYGALDIGAVKATGSPLALARGDNNYLGFKGTEDLGSGLSALFRIEQRFQPDTGTVESGNRPLFQGRTVVGLSGSFGTIRLGRDLTALQSDLGDYDPWYGNSSNASLFASQFPGGYVSGNAPGNGARFSNALFYTSPDMSGLTLKATIATKEADITTVTETPFSLSGTYKNGPVAAMLAYERNTNGDKLGALAGSYKLGTANLMASYSKLTSNAGANAKGWNIGADIAVGAGSIKVGYGQDKLDGAVAAKQSSLGYAYNLSKRTFLYTDVTNVKTVGSFNSFDVGIHHSF